MRLEHYSIEKLTAEVQEIMERYLDTKKYCVFFFGSRVGGKGSDRSDIDIGINGPEAVPFNIMAKIRDEIENIPTLYKFDVVDFKLTSKEFIEVAGKQIEYIH